MLNQAWHKNLSGLIALVYMGLIFRVSSEPSVQMPVWFAHQDKLHHFLEFFILAFLLAHAAPGTSMKKRFWLAFAIASVYGITDEVHQSFVPGRESSPFDWIADTVGGWVGAYLSLKSEGLFRRSNR